MATAAGITGDLDDPFRMRTIPAGKSVEELVSQSLNGPWLPEHSLLDPRSMMIEAGPAALDCSTAKPMDCSLDSYSAAWVVIGFLKVVSRAGRGPPEPEDFDASEDYVMGGGVFGSIRRDIDSHLERIQLANMALYDGDQTVGPKVALDDEGRILVTPGVPPVREDEDPTPPERGIPKASLDSLDFRPKGRWSAKGIRMPMKEHVIGRVFGEGTEMEMEGSDDEWSVDSGDFQGYEMILSLGDIVNCITSYDAAYQRFHKVFDNLSFALDRVTDAVVVEMWRWQTFVRNSMRGPRAEEYQRAMDEYLKADRWLVPQVPVPPVTPESVEQERLAADTAIAARVAESRNHPWLEYVHHVNVSARLMESMEEHEAWNGMGEDKKPAVLAAQREWAALCRAAAKFQGATLTTEMSYIQSFVSVVYKAVVLPKNVETAFKHVQQHGDEYDSESDDDGSDDLFGSLRPFKLKHSNFLSLLPAYEDALENLKQNVPDAFALLQRHIDLEVVLEPDMWELDEESVRYHDLEDLGLPASFPIRRLWIPDADEDYALAGALICSELRYNAVLRAACGNNWLMVWAVFLTHVARTPTSTARRPCKAHKARKSAGTSATRKRQKK